MGRVRGAGAVSCVFFFLSLCAIYRISLLRASVNDYSSRDRFIMGRKGKSSGGDASARKITSKFLKDGGGKGSAKKKGGTRGKASKRADSGIAREDMYNEVDEFHEQRNKIMLRKAGMESSDEGSSSSDSDGGDTAVLNLQVSDSSGDDSSSSDDDDNRVGDSELENESEEEVVEGATANWGKKKSFYGDEDSDDAEGSEDEALLVEEAKRLQREDAAELDAKDFDLSDSDDEETAEAGSKASKTGKKSKRGKEVPDEASALKRVNATLNLIDFDGVSVEVVDKKKSKLTEEQKLEIVMRDAPELPPLLEDFAAKARELKEQLLPVIEKVQKEREAFRGSADEHGLSYLEMKLHVLLNYCTNLGFYLVMKASGQSIVGHPVVDHLLQLRTTMEKMKPLDAKLKYQIDKLLKLAVTGGEGVGAAADALSYRPNMGDLSGSDENDGSSSDDNGPAPPHGPSSSAASDVYVPPKRTAVQYFEDETLSGKAKREDERRQRRLRQSTMLTELAQEFSDKPEEIREERTGDARLDRLEAERTRFEEEYMTRLTVTKDLKKKRKAAERRKGMVGGIGKFEDFDEIDAMINEETEAEKMAKLDWDRRRAMKQQLNQLEQQQRKGSRRNDGLSGDQDVEFRDPKEVQRRIQQDMTRRAMLNRPLSDDEGNDAAMYPPMPTAEDDEVYVNAKRKREDKVADRKQKYEYEPTFSADEAGEDSGDELRKANYQIIKNRGLVPHRKKEMRNPRVRARNKYERASKRIKGQIRQVRTGEADRYGGETTGVRSDLARSRKMD